MVTEQDRRRDNNFLSVLVFTIAGSVVVTTMIIQDKSAKSARKRMISLLAGTKCWVDKNSDFLIRRGWVMTDTCYYHPNRRFSIPRCAIVNNPMPLHYEPFGPNECFPDEKLMELKNQRWQITPTHCYHHDTKQIVPRCSVIRDPMPINDKEE